MKYFPDETYLELIDLDEIIDYFKRNDPPNDKYELYAGGSFDTKNYSGIYSYRPNRFILNIILSEAKCICENGFLSVDCSCEWDAEDVFFEIIFTKREWNKIISNNLKLKYHVKDL